VLGTPGYCPFGGGIGSSGKGGFCIWGGGRGAALMGSGWTVYHEPRDTGGCHHG